MPADRETFKSRLGLPRGPTSDHDFPVMGFVVPVHVYPGEEKQMFVAQARWARFAETRRRTQKKALRANSFPSYGQLCRRLLPGRRLAAPFQVYPWPSLLSRNALLGS